MEATGALTESDWALHRSAVFGAAYRILGTVTEAEDVVQDVWLRAAAADLSEVRDLRAWLVTLAARTSYNVLKSARVRRESYVGPWLPEPLLTGPDAVDQVLTNESVSTAMLVVAYAVLFFSRDAAVRLLISHTSSAIRSAVKGFATTQSTPASRCSFEPTISPQPVMIAMGMCLLS